MSETTPQEGGFFRAGGIDPIIAEANRMTMNVILEHVKARELSPEDLANRLGVDERELRLMFSTTMPYDVLLQICKITGTGATAVFDEVRTRMMDRHHTYAPTASSPIADASGPASETQLVRAPGDVDLIAAPVKAASTSSDTGPSTDGPVDDRGPSVDVSGSPSSLPFDLQSFDTDLKGADALIMNWAAVVQDAVSRRGDIPEDRRRRMVESYPKPLKTAPDRVDLSFPSYRSAQGFVNGGYLKDLNDVVGEKDYGVTMSVPTMTKRDSK